jgi:lysylphosphatidylglycerol synthetase-like protein (DUF2156 family)
MCPDAAGGRLTVVLPPGGQALVLGEPDPAAPAELDRLAAHALALRLDQLQGPAVLVLSGDPGSLLADPALADALERFAGAPDRRVLWLRATPLAPEDRPPVPGIEAAGEIELCLTLPTGSTPVLLRAAPPAPASPAAGLPGPGPRRAPILAGLELCSDRTLARRLIASRLAYRRFLPLASLLGVLALGSALVAPHAWHGLLLLLARVSARRRALPPGGLAGALLLVLVLLLAGLLSALGVLRGRRTLGALPATGPHQEDQVGSDPTKLLDPEEPALGLIVAGPSPAALALVEGRLVGAPGRCGRRLEARPARLGLPTVFEVQEQVSWLELEAGANLHGRLLAVRRTLPRRLGGLGLLERVASGRPVLPGAGLDAHPLAGTDLAAAEATPVVLAVLPHGTPWPPPADDHRRRVHQRRVRRFASGALALAGLADLLSAARAPLAAHLDPVLTALPLSLAQAAGALEVLAGVGLLALARGIRRGQQRAWRVALGLLTGSLLLHLVRGGEPPALVVNLGVLAALAGGRRAFGARSDRPSLATAGRAVGGGLAVMVGAAWAAVALQGHLDGDGHRPMPPGRALLAVLERLWGDRQVAIPGRLDGFLSPSLLAAGVLAAVFLALLATRPVVERTRGSSAARVRARAIVARHSRGSLDYFALRHDKQLFFHGESVVAYRHLGGICLVSPDPIGPLHERQAVWTAFRRFADDRGWTVAVLGAGPSWLPVYHAAGLRSVYLGDEAVVDVQGFCLAGNQMKGLRQACTRVARHGYRARLCSPADLDPPTRAALARLAREGREGSRERGFSMMLGRFWAEEDPEVLLCLVLDPEGVPVAFCQFVPAPGIGGYSLDVTRRDRGPHPNGLVDFALVATIEHLRANGARSLSLNFATLRAVLAEETGGGLAARAQRWALLRLSHVFQIESLWRFTAKYRPRWVPRYLCLENPEHLLPTLAALVRAEGLWDVPGFGRLVGAAARLRGRLPGGRSGRRTEPGGSGSAAQGRTSKVA